MGIRRRQGVIGAAVLGVAGVGAAIAMAAVPAPGTPQSTRVQATWQATLVKSAERTCTSADGEPVRESVEMFQAPASATTASDPRLDGRLDVYVHSIVYHGDDRRGLIDGNAHWFNGDSGPQTAYAKVAGILFGHLEAIMGGRSYDDGFVVRMDPRPKAKLFAPFQVVNPLDGNGQLVHFGGGFGAPFLITATDGLTQAFLCDGAYVDVPLNGAATTARAARAGATAGGQGKGPTVAQLVRMTKESKTEAQVLATERPPFPLLAGKGSGPGAQRQTATGDGPPVRQRR